MTRLTSIINPCDSDSITLQQEVLSDHYSQFKEFAIKCLKYGAYVSWLRLVCATMVTAIPDRLKCISMTCLHHCCGYIAQTSQTVCDSELQSIAPEAAIPDRFSDVISFVCYHSCRMEQESAAHEKDPASAENHLPRPTSAANALAAEERGADGADDGAPQSTPTMS